MPSVATFVLLLLSLVMGFRGLRVNEAVGRETWPLFCHHVHYFASADAVDDWFHGRVSKPIVLSIDEAYELGRLAFGHMLADGH